MVRVVHVFPEPVNYDDKDVVLDEISAELGILRKHLHIRSTQSGSDATRLWRVTSAETRKSWFVARDREHARERARAVRFDNLNRKLRIVLRPQRGSASVEESALEQFWDLYRHWAPPGFTKVPDKGIADAWHQPRPETVRQLTNWMLASTDIGGALTDWRETPSGLVYWSKEDR